MIDPAAVPAPIAIAAAGFALLGAVLTLLGTIGLVRLGSFFDRLHAPTLGASWGTGAILVASALLSVTDGEVAPLREIVIGAFILMTSAATMVTLAGAALHRERRERAAAGEPPPDAPAGERGTGNGADGVPPTDRPDPAGARAD